MDREVTRREGKEKERGKGREGRVEGKEGREMDKVIKVRYHCFFSPLPALRFTMFVVVIVSCHIFCKTWLIVINFVT